MATVTFKFDGSEDIVAHAVDGDSLLEIARIMNVAIDAPCSGNGACGKCKVQLLSGELDSKQTHHITDEEYNAGWRLACVSKLKGDVEIGIPDIASAYKSRMKVAD
jgi:ferredoxin